MTRYVYVSPILPGKSAEVQRHYRAKRERETAELSDPDRDRYFETLGLTAWNAWLQRCDGYDLFVHYLEGESLEAIHGNLREMITKGHPMAVWLRDFYLDILGQDYSDSAVAPRIKELVSIAAPVGAGAKSVCRAYAYPLLSGKEETHEEYTVGRAVSDLSLRQAVLTSLGTTHLTKWIQHTPERSYLVYYQEKAPCSRAEEVALLREIARETISNAAIAALTDHTGLSLEQLIPNVEPLMTRETVVPALQQ